MHHSTHINTSLKVDTLVCLDTLWHVPNISMSHGPHIDKSRLTYQCVMVNISTNESRLTYQYITAHISMSHGPHIHESRLTYP